MDPLSDVLSTVRLEGAVFLDAEGTAPWCARTRFGLMAAAGLPGEDNPAVFFHFMLEGRCKVRLEAGGETVEAGPGDMILLPHDDTHILGSDLQLTPHDSTRLVSIPAPGEMMQVRIGGGGEATRFVCGYLFCDRRTSRPLFDSLPRLLRIPLGAAADSTHPRGRVGLAVVSGATPGADRVRATDSSRWVSWAIPSTKSSAPGSFITSLTQTRAFVLCAPS